MLRDPASRLPARACTSAAWVAVAVAALALACGPNPTPDVGAARIGACGNDGWCQAELPSGVAAEFPGAVVETVKGTDALSRTSGIVRVLATRDERGVRYALSCVEYGRGRAPSAAQTLSSFGTLGTWRRQVFRGGVSGRLLEVRNAGAKSLIQLFVERSRTCFQSVEARDAPTPSETRVTRFFQSIRFTPSGAAP